MKVRAARVLICVPGLRYLNLMTLTSEPVSILNSTVSPMISGICNTIEGRNSNFVDGSVRDKPKSFPDLDAYLGSDSALRPYGESHSSLKNENLKSEVVLLLHFLIRFRHQNYESREVG